MGAEPSVDGKGRSATGDGGQQRVTEAVLRAVMAGARSVIVGIRADGSWFPISPAFGTVLDTPPSGVLLDLVHPHDRRAAVALFVAARRSPDLTKAVDVRLRAADGRWLVLETVASGQLDIPDVGAVLFYGRDVTALRQTERALRAVQRELHEHIEALGALARQKNEFVASISHELRSPLTVIVSFAHLLADPAQGELSDEQQRFVAVVNRNAGHMIRLIDDLMLLARIDAGALSMAPSAGSPSELVATAVADHAPAADAVGVALRTDLRDGPPAVFDEVRMHQVLANVIGNALKFTPAGGSVTVRARGDGDGWRIEVADTGVGIPAAEIEGVCAPFARGTNARGAGAGLGLVVSRAIMELHSGALELHSVEGEGTTVVIRLPAGQP